MTKEEIVRTLSNYAEIKRKATQKIKSFDKDFERLQSISIDDENDNLVVVGYWDEWSDGTLDFDTTLMPISDFIEEKEREDK